MVFGVFLSLLDVKPFGVKPSLQVKASLTRQVICMLGVLKVESL